MELLHTFACGFKQTQEFFFIQDTELAIATADAQLLISILFLFLPMIHVEGFTEAFTFLFERGILSVKDFLIYVHLEVFMHSPIAAHVILELQVAMFKLLNIMPHLIEA